MSHFSLRLPDTLMEQTKALAKSDHVSLNPFFLSAISEKMGELKTKLFFKNVLKRMILIRRYRF